MPGYALGIGNVASYMEPFFMRAFDWGEERAARDRSLVDGSPLLVVLGTENDRPEDWIRAGQALARLLLRAASSGVFASYLNQPIKLEELRTRFVSLIRRPGSPQLLFRLGFGDVLRATPRREADAVVVC